MKNIFIVQDLAKLIKKVCLIKVETLTIVILGKPHRTFGIVIVYFKPRL